MIEMTSEEKDMYLLGVVSCSLNNSPLTLSTNLKNDGRVKNRLRSFYYGYRRICKETFLFLYDISRNKLTRVSDHFSSFGCVPRKKLAGMKPFPVNFIV